MNRVQHFPLVLFAALMGLLGFILALRLALAAAGISPTLSLWLDLGLLLPISGLFLLFLGLFIGKILFFRAEWQKDLQHPVRLNFLAAISINLSLLALLYLHYAPLLAKVLWISAAGLHFLITLYIVSAWMQRSSLELPQMTPAWFIPAVGNIVMPLAGVPLGFVELSWFFFSVGLIFWLVLLTIVMQRIFFHPPLPERLAPTLLIWLAPPSIGFLSYEMLQGGQLDVLARILYYVGLFMAALFMFQINYFRKLSFAMSWWAYSFPVAALTNATFHFAKVSAGSSAIFFTVLAWGLFGLLAVIIALLLYKTFHLWMKNALFVAE
jgi:tellurite resistance protein